MMNRKRASTPAARVGGAGTAGGAADDANHLTCIKESAAVSGDKSPQALELFRHGKTGRKQHGDRARSSENDDDW
jgi:hypothetical protein